MTARLGQPEHFPSVLEVRTTVKASGLQFEVWRLDHNTRLMAVFFAWNSGCWMNQLFDTQHIPKWSWMLDEQLFFGYLQSRVIGTLWITTPPEVTSWIPGSVPNHWDWRGERCDGVTNSFGQRWDQKLKMLTCNYLPTCWCELIDVKHQIQL